MIVTLTPNPSLDVSIAVPRVERGSVLRAGTTRVDPGGKGINVARALAANGVATQAVVPAGGTRGEDLLGLLGAVPGLDVLPVVIAGPTRENVSLVEPDGTVTKINVPGPELSPREVAALRASVLQAADGADWVVLAGSLPPGAPVDLYARLVEDLHAAGALVAVDTSGAPMRAALASRPDLVKPNSHELAEVLDRPVRTLDELAAAAAELRAHGPAAVLASAGADGAVLVTADGAWYGDSPVAAPVSAVGAGDAMLAGYLAAHTRDAAPEAALAEALTWGSAAVTLPGSRMPGPEDLDRSSVRVGETAGPDRTLEEARA